MTTQPPTINGVDFAVGMDPVRAQIIRELHAATDRDKPDHALAQDARAADGHRLDQIADEQARRHLTAEVTRLRAELAETREALRREHPGTVTLNYPVAITGVEVKP